MLVPTGLAAAILLLFNGDIMGASGIVSSVILDPRKALTDSSQSWKLAFLAVFAGVANLFFASDYVDARLGADSRIPVLSSFGYCLAGLLVGFGTRLGNGCTSGHGICGLGRMSLRSLAAVVAFLCTAILIATITSPASGLAAYTTWLRADQTPNKIYGLGDTVTLVVVLLAVISLAFKSILLVKRQQYNDICDASTQTDHIKIPAATIAGGLFAVGLFISGMVLPSKVYGFLDVAGLAEGSYDPTLAMVMIGGMLISWLSYQFVEGHGTINLARALQKPVCAACFSVPDKKTIDWPLLSGATIFGIGWGLGGLCPGPAIFQAAVGMDAVVIFWWPAFFVGAFIAERIINARNRRLEGESKKSPLINASAAGHPVALADNPASNELHRGEDEQGSLPAVV